MDDEGFFYVFEFFSKCKFDYIVSVLKLLYDDYKLV